MTLQVHSPYDNSLVAELALDTDASVEEKLERARAAQADWRRVPVAERVAQVTLAMEWFREHTDEVARDVTLQMGKPLAQSTGEVEGLLKRAQFTLDVAPEVLAPEILPAKEGFRRRIEHTPLGLVLDIAAWNYPLLIPTNVIFPALLAGNGVLLKHSARTPLCGQHFERAFEAAGLEGLVTHLVLDHANTTALMGDARVGHVAFTGSVDAGRRIHRAVAERFIDVGLELGGNDPAYVAADADLEATVACVVEGACYNAGQSCCAVERVYVHADVYDEFMDLARVLMEAYRMGDPLDPATTLGPLADAGSLEGMARQVEDACERGASVVTGGSASEGRFFEATLLAGCPNDCEVMQEESFGPLLPVLRVESDDEALGHVNDTHFGLTASIWTADPERAEWFAAGHDAGTLFQNRCDYLDPALPWTGMRDSGKGSTLSRHGFHHLTRRKAIHFRDSPG
jgi:acyl-CoA reductase-like NAD-dependent aldehyde dehydrogenase